MGSSSSALTNDWQHQPSICSTPSRGRWVHGLVGDGGERDGQCMSLFINTGPANLSRLIEQKGEGTGVKHWQLRGVCASECSSRCTCFEYIPVVFLYILRKRQVSDIYNSWLVGDDEKNIFKKTKFLRWLIIESSFTSDALIHLGDNVQVWIKNRCHLQGYIIYSQIGL